MEHSKKTVNIPEAVHRAAKTSAAALGVSMAEFVTRSVQEGTMKKPDREARSMVGEAPVHFQHIPSAPFNWDDTDLSAEEIARHRVANRPWTEEDEAVRCRRLGIEYVGPAERERRSHDRSELIWALGLELDAVPARLSAQKAAVAELEASIATTDNLVARGHLRARWAEALTAVDAIEFERVSLAKQIAEHRAEMKEHGVKLTSAETFEKRQLEDRRAWLLQRKAMSFGDSDRFGYWSKEIGRKVRFMRTSSGPAREAIIAELAREGVEVLPDGRAVMALGE